MDASSWVMIGLLVLLVVFMFIATRRQRKMQAEQMEKIYSLKVGDKVKTHIGVYGTIAKIYDSTDGKIAVIEIGDKNKVQFEMEMRYVAGLDQKTEVTFNENEASETSGVSAQEIEKAKEEIKDKIEETKKTEDNQNTENTQEEISKPEKAEKAEIN